MPLKGELVGWRAWYPDKRYQSSNCVDCLADEFAKLPSEGLQIIVLFGPKIAGTERRARDFVSGGDWYWPFTCLESRHYDGTYLLPPEDIKPEFLKKGLILPNDEFKRIWDEAWADNVWP